MHGNLICHIVSRLFDGKMTIVMTYGQLWCERYIVRFLSSCQNKFIGITDMSPNKYVPYFYHFCVTGEMVNH